MQRVHQSRHVNDKSPYKCAFQPEINVANITYCTELYVRYLLHTEHRHTY